DRYAASTEPYSLSLHDALPISSVTVARRSRSARIWACIADTTSGGGSMRWISTRTTRTPHVSVASSSTLRSWVLIRSRLVNAARSEEHTSELQSREKLVCRLLL